MLRPGAQEARPAQPLGQRSLPGRWRGGIGRRRLCRGWLRLRGLSHRRKPVGETAGVATVAGRAACGVCGSGRGAEGVVAGHASGNGAILVGKLLPLDLSPTGCIFPLGGPVLSPGVERHRLRRRRCGTAESDAPETAEVFVEVPLSVPCKRLARCLDTRRPDVLDERCGRTPNQDTVAAVDLRRQQP